MAQRFSGRERQANEFYSTPAWVIEAALPFLGRGRLSIWEPACGDGAMVRALSAGGHSVVASDIELPEDGEAWPVEGELCTARTIQGTGRIWRHDFLKAPHPLTDAEVIFTNPPYGTGGRIAVAFIEKALELTKLNRGMVVMLLKIDFDSAKGRAHLFSDHPAWGTKVVLRRRILWFASENGMQPSENHGLYLWDWRHKGPPTIEYAP